MSTRRTPMDPVQLTFDRVCTNTGSSGPLRPSFELRFPLSITILIYIAYFIPFCFGVFGNVSVCLIFFKQKKLRSITNTFLMNLCVNDLIVLCVSIPMTLSAALLENWAFGAFLCKIVHFTPTVTALVSTFTVAVIAVERWFFIVNKRKFHRRCTIVTLILLWLISIVIASPEMLSRQMKDLAQVVFEQSMYKNAPFLRDRTNASGHFPPPVRLPCPTRKLLYCYAQPSQRTRIFSYIVLTVQYLVPFLFVSVSCYSISRFLKRRMIRMRSYQTQYRPPRNVKKPPRKKSINLADEATSHEDLAAPDLIDDSQTTGLLACFRQLFQKQEPLPTESPRTFNLADQQQLLKVQSHTKRRFHRSRKLLIYVAALFTISWLPLTIVQIYIEHNHDAIYQDSRHKIIYGYLLIPCYLISSVSAWANPVIYNYINRSFRREFYLLYSCCFKKASSTPGREITTIVARQCRPRAIQIDGVTSVPPTDVTGMAGAAGASPSHALLKAPTPGVSFANETVVMMHDAI